MFVRPTSLSVMFQDLAGSITGTSVAVSVDKLVKTLKTILKTFVNLRSEIIWRRCVHDVCRLFTATPFILLRVCSCYHCGLKVLILFGFLNLLLLLIMVYCVEVLGGGALLLLLFLIFIWEKRSIIVCSSVINGSRHLLPVIFGR